MTETPSSDSAGASPVDTLSLDPAARDALETMRFTAAMRFRVNPAEAVPQAFERTAWPDDCVGIAQDRACRPGAIAGYKLLLRIAGQNYQYHAKVNDALGFVLAAGPDPGMDTVALSWRMDGVDVGCRSLRIAPSGMAAIGACGGPHEAHPLIEEVDRLTEWRYFHE